MARGENRPVTDLFSDVYDSVLYSVKSCCLLVVNTLSRNQEYIVFARPFVRLHGCEF